jgi:hypothetical protein
VSRIARTVSFLALGIGIAYGIFILFGPTYTICSSGSIGPNQTPGPTTCHSESLVVTQRESLFPAPLLWILIWSLAPVLAIVGVRFRADGTAGGSWLIGLAFLMDLTGIISMGGGFVYALVVAPLLLITLIASFGIHPRMG